MASNSRLNIPWQPNYEWDKAPTMFRFILFAIVTAIVWSASSPENYHEFTTFVIWKVTHLVFTVKMLGSLGLAPFGADALFEIFEMVENVITGKGHSNLSVLVAGVACAFIAAGTPFALGYYFVSQGNTDLAGVPYMMMATDIVLAISFGINLPEKLKKFLLTLAVADDLIGLVVILAFFGGHAFMSPLIVLLLFGIAGGMIWLARETENAYIMFASGFPSTFAMFGLGIEPILGYLLQTFFLIGKHHNFYKKYKWIMIPFAMVGLVFFLITHLDASNFSYTMLSLKINFWFLVGKTIPVTIGGYIVSRDFVHSLLTGALASVGATVSLIFLEITEKAGLLGHEHVAEVQAAILMTVAVGAVIWLMSKLHQKRLQHEENPVVV